MIVEEPLRLVLELAPNRRPVEGSVRWGRDEARAFTGWMELVAALESVLERTPPGPADVAPARGSNEE